MSETKAKLSDSMDLLGAVAGFFIIIFIWIFMVNWGKSKPDQLSNTQAFQLTVSILILVPLFVYGCYIFARGVWNLIWEFISSRVETTSAA